MNTTNMVRATSNRFKKNLPTLLTGTGLALGTLAMVIIAQKSPRAKLKKKKALLRAKKKKLNKLQTAWEIVKATAPDYAVPIGLGIAAAGCIIGSDVIVNKRLAETTGKLATVTAGYLALQDRFDKYKQTAKEVLGEEKKKDLDRKAYENMAKSAENSPETAYESKRDFPGLPQLFYDVRGNRYVRATIDGLRAAENELNMMVYNRRLDGDGTRSIEDGLGPNDFYDLMGWDQIPLANAWIFPPKLCFSCGENGIHMILKDYIMAPNGESAMVLDFENLKEKWDVYKYS